MGMIESNRRARRQCLYNFLVRTAVSPRLSGREVRQLVLSHDLGMHIARLPHLRQARQGEPDGIVIGNRPRLPSARRSSAMISSTMSIRPRALAITAIGAHAVIMPGITVGDHSIVAIGDDARCSRIRW
jgi:hypothetical protein